MSAASNANRARRRRSPFPVGTRIGIAILALNAVTAAGVVAYVIHSQQPEPVVHSDVRTTLEPCPTEDSANCIWDASVSGNQTGVSFIDWNGVTYYEESAK